VTAPVATRGEIRIGISGWVYPRWRGTFYPKGLAQHRELAYASERLNSIEINGTFYSLQKPSSFAKWRDETPDGFRFAVKGSRFITHMKKLRDPGPSLANYFASGVPALGEKLGPILWQLGPHWPLDLARLEEFFAVLPRTTSEAAKLAQGHDERFGDDAWTQADTDRPIRHALEPRHPSFFVPEVVRLLRKHGIALVIADTAETFPFAEDVTADFVYLRLHGLGQLYVGGYTDESLDWWADRIRSWTCGEEPKDARKIEDVAAPTAARRDAYVYFDNDAKVRAPFDAMSLLHKLGITSVCADVPAPPVGLTRLTAREVEERRVEAAERWKPKAARAKATPARATRKKGS
jgi:uncharacterized protein YecE (DUF72 family)